MNKKLLLIFVAVFSVAVFFIIRLQRGESHKFSLIDQIEERQIMGVFNLTQLIKDGRSIGSRFRTLGLAESYFDKVKETLQGSGLRLDKVYYSLETRDSFRRSLYFEITDRAALKSTFRNFSNFYNLEQDSLDTSIYYSTDYGIALRMEEKWLEVIQGEIDNLEHKPNISNTSRELLEEAYFFILNPTHKKELDSLEYIVGNYHYDSIFSFTGEWHCARKKQHPVQAANQRIAFYPTDKRVIEGYINVDREKWGQYENVNLKKNLESIYSSGMFDYPNLSEFWNGQFTLNYGGKIVVENETIITEFDENFNQIERTVIQKDSIRDVGFVFSSDKPEKLHQELLNQKNIEKKNGQTYVALLPPLNKRYMDDRLILSTDDKKLSEMSAPDVIHFSFKSSQLNVLFKGQTKGNSLNYQLELIPQVQGKIKFDEIINVFL